FSSRRRHTRSYGDWSSDVCSSDLIDAAAQAKDYELVTDLRANFANGLVEVIVHGPIAAAPADVMDKVADDFRAARRMHDFGMKRSEERRVGKECRSRVER